MSNILKDMQDLILHPTPETEVLINDYKEFVRREHQLLLSTEVSTQSTDTVVTAKARHKEGITSIDINFDIWNGDKIALNKSLVEAVISTSRLIVAAYTNYDQQLLRKEQELTEKIFQILELSKSTTTENLN